MLLDPAASGHAGDRELLFDFSLMLLGQSRPRRGWRSSQRLRRTPMRYKHTPRTPSMARAGFRIMIFFFNLSMSPGKQIPPAKPGAINRFPNNPKFETPAFAIFNAMFPTIHRRRSHHFTRTQIAASTLPTKCTGLVQARVDFARQARCPYLFLAGMSSPTRGRRFRSRRNNLSITATAPRCLAWNPIGPHPGKPKRSLGVRKTVRPGRPINRFQRRQAKIAPGHYRSRVHRAHRHRLSFRAPAAPPRARNYLSSSERLRRVIRHVITSLLPHNSSSAGGRGVLRQLGGE